MESYEEIIYRLKEMESRYHDGFSSSDRQLLDRLHYTIFSKVITNAGCSDCYRDAYLLIRTQLKKDKKMPKKPNYVLKGGAFIHPAGTSDFYTNPLKSDDIAEDYLSKFPNQIILFAEYPSDWETRIAAYKARQEEQKDKDDETLDACTQDLDSAREAVAGYQEEQKRLLALLSEKNAEIARKDETIAKLNKTIEEQAEQQSTLNEESSEDNEELEGLKMELETAKTELEAAQKEISELKTENRALKAANTRLKNNGVKDT